MSVLYHIYKENSMQISIVSFFNINTKYFIKHPYNDNPNLHTFSVVKENVNNYYYKKDSKRRVI